MVDRISLVTQNYFGLTIRLSVRKACVELTIVCSITSIVIFVLLLSFLLNLFCLLPAATLLLICCVNVCLYCYFYQL